MAYDDDTTSCFKSSFPPSQLGLGSSPGLCHLLMCDFGQIPQACSTSLFRILVVSHNIIVTLSEIVALSGTHQKDQHLLLWMNKALCAASCSSATKSVGCGA